MRLLYFLPSLFFAGILFFIAIEHTKAHATPEVKTPVSFTKIDALASVR